MIYSLNGGRVNQETDRRRNGYCNIKKKKKNAHIYTQKSCLDFCPHKSFYNQFSVGMFASPILLLIPYTYTFGKGQRTLID